MSERRHRVLFAGRHTYDLPLDAHLAKKWDALEQLLDVRVIGSRGSVSAGDPRFDLVAAGGPAGGARFYGGLPRRIERAVREFSPDVLIVQSPFEGAMALLAPSIRRRRVPLVIEVHGDWRTASRLYGSPRRRLAAPVADAVAVAALRRARAVRTVGPRMTELVREATGRPPRAEFPTFFDAEPFFARPVVPVPDAPAVLWVGVLQRYKNPQLLADAWPRVASRVPAAQLVVVGRGPIAEPIDELRRRFGEQVRHEPVLSSARVAAEMDAARALVLPSRSEGLPRVGIESFARGRGIVGTRVDGISDLVQDGRNGLLVPDGDAEALAEALVRVLSDGDLARRLGEAARETAEERFRPDPASYARNVRDLVAVTAISAA